MSQSVDKKLSLLERGYNEEQIKKILGGNFLRVFRQILKN